MTRLRAVGRLTFAAFAVPNYRHYMSGQAVSLVGTWMQMIAQSWLVLTLTHSSIDLGLIVAIPALIFWRYFRGRVDEYLLTLELAAERFARHLNQLRRA